MIGSLRTCNCAADSNAAVRPNGTARQVYARIADHVRRAMNAKAPETT